MSFTPAHLASTYYLDFENPAVRAYSERAGSGSPREKAVRLYEMVRDELRYDPYSVRLVPEAMRASATLAAGRGFCVNKAVVLAAVCRAQGIPARLGFADVRNHLATPRLLELMGTTLFVFHGYADLFVDGRWVKATPAFNAGLCEKFKVAPLPFDGRKDAVLQAQNHEGTRFMEYVKDRGVHDDLPFDELLRGWREAYPALMALAEQAWQGDFEAEAASSGKSS